MQRRCLLPLMWFLGFLAVPEAAHANGITPLLFGAALYLGCGNLVIGIIEGALLAWFSHEEPYRTFLPMILANFLSAWAGSLLLAGYRGMMGTSALMQTPRPFFAMLLLATFAVTLVLEWPFCFWVLRSFKDRVRTSIKATLITQTTSYALLLPFFLYFVLAEK